MRKIQHVIKVNAGGRYPTRVVFLDTASKMSELVGGHQEHELRLGVAEHVRYDSRGRADHSARLQFVAAEIFWGWLFDRMDARTRTYLIADNLEFDWQLLDGFRFVGRSGLIPKKFISGGGKLIMTFRYESSSLVVLDSMNYFRCSLSKLAKWVGRDEIPKPSLDSPEVEWVAYCMRNVEILRQAWEKWMEFLREHDCGSFANTIAGQAWNCYRRRFMSVPLYVHDRKAVTALERAAYHGGRAECFRIGNFTGETFSLLDISSHYPAMMMRHPYPVKLLYRRINLPLQELSELLQQYSVIARCRIKTDEPAYGIKLNGLLIFPIGEFSGAFCTPELRYALERGHLMKCEDAAIYEQADIFSSYIRYWWLQRKACIHAGDSAGEMFCKLMLNSLFGRFGLRVQCWEKSGDADSPEWSQWSTIDADTGEMIISRRWCGRVEELRGWIEGFDSMPAVPAHITAYGRMRMWEIITRAGRENILYCDTDSVITNEKGKDRLSVEIRDGELGFLRVMESSQHVGIFGIKHYSIRGTSRCARLGHNDVEVAPGLFASFQQAKFSGRTIYLPPGKALWRRVLRRLAGHYRHGILNEDGTVSPLRLVAPQEQPDDKCDDL